MKPKSRLLHLDWVRGLAAIIMLQGHVFNSFTRQDFREGGPYLFSQFVGGMPPAIFLFLTGITLAFLMHSQERKGMPAGGRVLQSLKRAGYLFAIAFLFRIQLWVFSRFLSSVDNPWTDIFRVDILNCMGFAIAVMSVMAIFNTAERVKLCAILGLAIALAAPMVTQLDLSGVPPMVRDYLVPSTNFFGFFPWAAFLAFGLSAGSLLKVLRDDQMMQTMQWAALAGIALSLGAHSISNMGYSLYTKSDFWLDSPLLILIKTGVVLVLLAFAYLWTSQASARGWSWVRQFGTTSLLVYWVHIELVYGNWLGFMKNNLNIGQTVAAAVLVTVLMLALSVAKTYYKDWRVLLQKLGLFPDSVPERVSGD